MSAAEEEFGELLAMLKDTRGFDLAGYKPTTLIRRVKRRIDSLGLQTFGEYRDYLELEPDEFALLLDSLLINVTAFFRDPDAWSELRHKVIPQLLAAQPGRPLRLWSAGCATGEEAYTLAIVMAEALGAEAFCERVKIYATDLDEDALQQARTGSYLDKQLAGLPEDLRKAYFEPSGQRQAFRRDLRRQVIFGRNDLTRDAPISRVDLLVARNTLMYFNAEAQATIVRRFHFALADPGFLFLGKAEMLLNHGEHFEPVDLRKRLFRKVPGTLPAGAPRQAAWPGYIDQVPSAGRLEAAALDTGPAAQLAIDLAGTLAVANNRASTLFGLHPRDTGRLFHDLEVSYRPVELRSIIDRVKREQRQVELCDVAWHRTAALEPDVFDVHVIPLFSAPGELAGIGVNFIDVTRYRRLRDELEHANTELERAYEELQSLNEELETTNEELQSTNEELETTNEELQSTNEELETMNQELQSTNDELQEINDALRVRTGELDAANLFLGAVLRSLGSAVIVVGTDLRVQVWGPGAEEMWGVRPEEAEGQELGSLDIGLPLQQVTAQLRQMLAAGQPGPQRSGLAAVNRRGRPVRLEVECCLLHDEDAGQEVKGAILVINQLRAALSPGAPSPPAAR